MYRKETTILMQPHCPQVGDPLLCTKVSDELIRNYGHYVQAINYPTVPRGQEKLRIAPTPNHTKPMMDQFVKDLLVVWKELGLPLGNKSCPEVVIACCVVL